MLDSRRGSGVVDILMGAVFVKESSFLYDANGNGKTTLGAHFKKNELSF